jgi:hypothetical protein
LSPDDRAIEYGIEKGRVMTDKLFGDFEASLIDLAVNTYEGDFAEGGRNSESPTSAIKPSYVGNMQVGLRGKALDIREVERWMDICLQVYLTARHWIRCCLSFACLLEEFECL